MSGQIASLRGEVTYRPWDREEKLGKPPWKPDDPQVIAWEAAHGHDVRLKCYPEFGCQPLEAARERLEEAADALVREGCREELGAPTYDKCNKPAEFVLWGKLIEPEALGPRCYDHAAKHVGHGMLSRRLAGSDGYQLEAAIMDLRPLRRVLGDLVA